MIYTEYQHLDIVFILGAYLLGSIPFGYIFTKIFVGKDIRELGSKNVGATNVTRNAGKLAGSLTLLFDLLKGLAVVVLTTVYVEQAKNNVLHDIVHILVLITSFMALVGHFFPVWLKFRGGKGVATFFGIIAGFHIYLLAFALSVWIVIFLLFKISSLSALTTMLLTPIFSYIIWQKIGINAVYAIALFCLMIIIKHHSNIKKLIKGEEK